jgi:hypothetical protein
VYLVKIEVRDSLEDLKLNVRTFSMRSSECFVYRASANSGKLLPKNPPLYRLPREFTFIPQFSISQLSFFLINQHPFDKLALSARSRLKNCSHLPDRERSRKFGDRTVPSSRAKDCEIKGTARAVFVPHKAGGRATWKICLNR